MLQPNALKRALRKGEPVFGLFCSIPTPLMIEMIGYTGFDFVIVDTEHALVNPETLEHMLRAAEAVGLTALVRVPDSAAGAIVRVLDAGAQGVVIPRIRNRSDIQAAVRLSRYYPEGERGLNAGRSAGFGKLNLTTYLQTANAEIMVVAMIEDRQGVEGIEEILSVPGIDMVLEGAADLSQSLGVPWQTRHPAVRNALYQVQSLVQQQGIPFCAIPRVPEDLGVWWERGVRAFILGDERGVAYRALQAHLHLFQKQLEQVCKGSERNHDAD